MDDRTKVLVYGSFDGFTCSTDDSLLISVVLDGGEKVEIPEEFIVSADQMVNKYKIKLKDVIARIEKFDLATKAVWINEILNKLGSDYGVHKYYAGYKQGKLEGAIEPQKVTVPQFVADYIKDAKYYEWDLDDVFDHITEESEGSEISEWFYTLGNVDVFARAWLDGYEVEKEKRYTVKVKAYLGQFLGRYYLNNEELTPRFTRSQFTGKGEIPTFTRKELEGTGFGWVFDCPGIEIEEVEG